MYNDTKKICQILGDLKKIKKELKPKDEQDIEREKELKNMDKFGKKKQELSTLMRLIREDANKLMDIRRRQGDKRDAEVMKLINDNTRNLSECKTMWDGMKLLLADDIKHRAKKLGEKELSDRKKHLELFGNEIVTLKSAFSRVKGAGPTSIEEVQGARVTDKTQKRREDKQARKAKRANRKGGGFAELDEDKFKEIAPVNAQQQKFMDQVDSNKEKQDSMLDDITKGLEELKEMSLNINKQLKTQAAIIDEVETEIDTTIVALKSANSRMKDILDSNGGMSRWCPILCCMCLLVTILGYMFNLVPS